MSQHAATYKIQVLGRLDQHWGAYLQGMDLAYTMDSHRRTVTNLTGELSDQAALLGIINHLYDLGLQLLLVERIEQPDSSSSEGVAI